MTHRQWITGLGACALTISAAGVWTVARGAADTQASDADRQAIRSHIDRVFKAYIAQNRAEVKATHGTDWHGFLTNTRSIIKGLDQYMRAADRVLKSPQKLVGYSMEEFDVLFRGPDFAIVPYVAKLEGEAEGQRATWKLRVLDVYAREQGGWMQIASNTAMHPESIAEQRTMPQPLAPSERQELFEAREAVWRAWFAGDDATLKKLLPEETLALDSGPDGWTTREAIIKSAVEFARQGGKLVAVEYPRTEIQVYGSTAILYSSYRLDTEAGGKRSSQIGKAVEIFVNRGGQWVNTGWQLAPDQTSRPSQ